MLKKHTRIKIVTLALCSLAAMALPSASVLAEGEYGDGPHCQQQTLPVQLAAGDPTMYEVKGWLCWDGQLAGKTVQLLLSGFTYDHYYWDFPFQQDKYSYVLEATAEGYATFNIDRIGVGQSSHPTDPSTVTVTSEAFVTNQVVQALRAGNVAHNAFHKVIGVGHSYGAAIWIIEASSYPQNGGVDGLILADYLHQSDPNTVAALTAARWQAQQDPKFASASWALGYITTKPGYRYLFYNPDYADPRVIKKDEELKQTATIGEATTLGLARDPSFSQKIGVPVLLVVGQKDSLGCNDSLGLSCADNAAIVAREAANFSAQACLEAYVLPISGHDTNLHPDAKRWFKAAGGWSDRRVGVTDWHTATQPCLAETP